MTQPSRRQFLASAAAASVAATLLPALGLAQEGDEPLPSARALREAGRLAGLEFTDTELELMVNSAQEHLDGLRALADLRLPNDLAPATGFDPRLPGRPFPSSTTAPRPWPRDAWLARGATAADPTWLTVGQLAPLLRSRRLRATELLDHTLRRLRRLDPQLQAVVTVLEERAREQARRADEEMDQGRWRGPLHGVPWGAKDLLAVAGAPTTWGAAPYREQRLDHDAAVVTRLDDAGAVLVAKTSVGALAWGDVWYGGTTKNPWKLGQGSSGSSAGSASLVAAGVLPFALGSETLGSIVSPSSRCGTTGLRPTFGRVPRSGCMALSWTMDKIGPIARHAGDTALVLRAIAGADRGDPDSRDIPLGHQPASAHRALAVGFDEAAFAGGREGREEEAALDRQVLDDLRGMGHELAPVSLPSMPLSAMLVVLEVEAAAAFDELTRSDRDDELTRQVEQAWPNVFRAAQLATGVHYVQAQRARRRLMEEFLDATAHVDLYATPSFAGSSLLITNLTGQPCLVAPNGFRGDGTPTSISFVGRLDGEAELCALGAAWQESTGWHRQHPRL